MLSYKIFIEENMHLLNRLSIGFSMVGGVITWFLGGFDTLLIALASMMVLDYATGIIKAIYQKKLSSSIGFKGIIKKAVIFLVVGMSVVVQRIMPESIPLREITITFFICNEGLSLLENASVMIPLPKKLKSILLQLRKSTDAVKGEKINKKGNKKSEIADNESSETKNTEK